MIDRVEFQNYGKLRQSAGGPIVHGVGYAVTGQSIDFPDELTDRVSPAQWIPGFAYPNDALGFSARSEGAIFHRVVEDSFDNPWALIGVVREQSEAGEGQTGRRFIEGRTLALDVGSIGSELDWRLLLRLRRSLAFEPDLGATPEALRFRQPALSLEPAAAEVRIQELVNSIARLDGALPERAGDPRLLGLIDGASVATTAGLFAAEIARRTGERCASVVAHQDYSALNWLEVLALANAALGAPVPDFALGLSEAREEVINAYDFVALDRRKGEGQPSFWVEARSEEGRAHLLDPARARQSFAVLKRAVAYETARLP